MAELKNHRIVVARRGGPEVLQIVGEALPVPKPGEVRVKVQAAGVSAFDIMVRSRAFPGFPSVPFTPGGDIVGVVDEVGEGVPSLERGDVVAAFTFAANGGYAEYVCIPGWWAVPVPSKLDPAVAVALVVNYLTAHRALHEAAEVRTGEQLLIHGAAGGVGTAVVELGARAGLEMYGTASGHNHQLVSDLGATPIDYRNVDFVAEVRGLTGDGVDVVIDPISGARQLFRSYRALRRGGRLVMLGMVASEKSGAKAIPFSLAAVAALKLIPDGRTLPLLASMDKVYEEHKSRYRDTLTELLDLAAAGEITPVIADRIPLREAARAHELIERGGYAGKVVLVPQR